MQTHHTIPIEFQKISTRSINYSFKLNARQEKYFLYQENSLAEIRDITRLTMSTEFIDYCTRPYNTSYIFLTVHNYLMFTQSSSDKQFYSTQDIDWVSNKPCFYPGSIKLGYDKEGKFLIFNKNNVDRRFEFLRPDKDTYDDSINTIFNYLKRFSVVKEGQLFTLSFDRYEHHFNKGSPFILIREDEKELFNPLRFQCKEIPILTNTTQASAINRPNLNHLLTQTQEVYAKNIVTTTTAVRSNQAENEILNTRIELKDSIHHRPSREANIDNYTTDNNSDEFYPLSCGEEKESFLQPSWAAQLENLQSSVPDDGTTIDFTQIAMLKTHFEETDEVVRVQQSDTPLSIDTSFATSKIEPPPFFGQRLVTDQLLAPYLNAPFFEKEQFDAERLNTLGIANSLEMTHPNNHSQHKRKFDQTNYETSASQPKYFTNFKPESIPDSQYTYLMEQFEKQQSYYQRTKYQLFTLNGITILKANNEEVTIKKGNLNIKLPKPVGGSDRVELDLNEFNSLTRKDLKQIGIYSYRRGKHKVECFINDAYRRLFMEQVNQTTASFRNSG